MLASSSAVFAALIVSLLLANSCLSLTEEYVGSRFGTNDTNLEPVVLAEARQLMASVLLNTSYARISRPKTVLCASFVGTASLANAWVMRDNIAQTESACDWALIAYEHLELQEFCGLPGVVRCSISSALSERSQEGTTALHYDSKQAQNLNETGGSLKIEAIKSIPKSVLYFDLLPLLTEKDSPYDYVFLLDEDIYLNSFDLNSFVKMWRCVSLPQLRRKSMKSELIAKMAPTASEDALRILDSLFSPLIVQPMISGSRQYIPWVNSATWKRYDPRRKVFAQEVPLIEQQAPIFNAYFFRWFVQSVLGRIRETALHNGADWGHDRCWCSAAKAFQQELLQFTDHRQFMACAVFPHAQKIHHLNFRSMKLKKDNRNLFRRKAASSVQRYVDLFPTWVITDVLHTNNPFERKNKTQLMNIAVGQSCYDEH